MYMHCAGVSASMKKELFYGFDKKFISYAAVGAATPFSTPDDAFFVRFSQTLSTGADTQMLTKGTSKPSVYMGYGWRDWYSRELKLVQQFNTVL